MKITEEEIRKGRLYSQKTEENKPINEVSTFVGKLCKIRMNPTTSAYSEPEIHTGRITHINNNGVLLNENDEPIFISWSAIRTIKKDRLNIPPSSWH